jgi:hypothetical protein
MARLHDVTPQLVKQDRNGIELYAALRNDGREALGEGRGVADQAVIDNYFEAIAWARDTLAGHPFNMKKPERIRVVILDIGEILLSSQPFVDNNCNIYLPSRTRKATREEELRWMRSAAIHETTHVVCLSQDGFPVSTDLWHPLVEGTAVYVQTLDESSSIEAMPFFLTWCDHPERSLIDAPYTTSLFVHYLAHHRLPKAPSPEVPQHLVGQIWNYGSWDQDPWKVISELNGHADDVLFADYCLAAFFPYDALTAQVRDRYGERAFTSEYHLSPGQEVDCEATVERFACRYYAIHCDGASELSIDCSREEWSCLLLDAIILRPQRGVAQRIGKGGERKGGLPVGVGDTVLIVISNVARRAAFSFQVRVR